MTTPTETWKPAKAVIIETPITSPKPGTVWFIEWRGTNGRSRSDHPYRSHADALAMAVLCGAQEIEDEQARD